MSSEKCQSLENLIPSLTKNFSQSQLMDSFEQYRSDLHHELVKQWPFQSLTTQSPTTRPASSKSNPHSSISIMQKTVSTVNDSQTATQRLNHPSPTVNATGLIRRLSEVQNKIISTDSEISLENRQQRIEWNLKAQEGIVNYRLPDGLSDGVLLYNKLQKIMKTDTLRLNDRQFWTEFENRYKAQQRENFHRHMERLRRIQQDHEQELLSKGSLPHTTEEAVRLHAEQQRTFQITNPIPPAKTNSKKCFLDHIELNNRSRKRIDHSLPDEDHLLDPFESDNLHPRFHQLFINYPFQNSASKEMAEKYEENLKDAQDKIKTIFPKMNQRDRIQQELDAMKTSEGLYAYSNRLSKKIVKS